MSTAVGTYCTMTTIKARLGIAVTDTTDDSLITTIADQINMLIETTTGRILAPIASTTYTFDVLDAAGGRCLLVGGLGVRSISLLEVAPYTGAAFVTMPATDYFIEPVAQKRAPGWPGTEIWITDIPTAGNTYPYFPAGFGTVRITGTWGWAAIPDDVAEIALRTAVRAWTARQAGETDVIGTDEFGKPAINLDLSTPDRRTLERYEEKPVLVI